MEIMMIKFRKILLPAIIATLVGCGSDSDSNTQPPPDIPDSTPINDFDNINVALMPDQKLGGNVTVRIGKWVPCSAEYPSFCTDDGKNKETEFDYQHYYVESADLQRVLGRSIRPDIMAEGQFSLLDMALYLGKTRDDLEVTLGELNEELDTYEFTVSYDYNRDGKFSSEDGDEYYQSPNWWPANHYSNGDLLRDLNDMPMEAYYNRADTVPLQVGQNYRFRPYSKYMTERRQSVQKQEVERRNSNGKVIIPRVEVNFKDGRGFVTLATDVEVRPYNLRPDIYQPGVLTIADVLMTMYDDLGLDIGLTWWPVTTNNTPVRSYALSRVNDYEAGGYKGWLYFAGNVHHTGGRDFSDKMIYMSVAEIQSAPAGTFCPWLGELDDDEARACKEDFAQTFGGSFVHIMPDNWVVNNPPKSISFFWTNQNKYWETPTFSWDDNQFPWYDISKANEVMDESHFGWGYADCALCHNADEFHLSGDSPALGDMTKPYLCASCHGSNGAPQGHGEEARCHWCHTREYAPEHHGSASKEVLITEIECWDNPQKVAPCANDPELKMHPKNKAGNETSYSETMMVPVNSDWSQSQDFPDPYSCLTCHPNEVMEPTVH